MSKIRDPDIPSGCPKAIAPEDTITKFLFFQIFLIYLQISKWIFHQKNDFHLELLGAAGLYSINYERVIVN